jgi:outer membrane PBP1 activator LpoA protein
MNKSRISVFYKFFSMITQYALLIFSIILVSACASLLGPGTQTQEPIGPEDHKTQAGRYVALAEKAPETQAYEYRLRAADQYLKASQLQEARQIIRTVQDTGKNLDPQTQSTLLEARLALLQNDSRRAQMMLNNLLAPFAQNPHLLTSNPVFAGQKIALLLPSQGPHAAAAKTIRDGFLAAYYKTLQQSSSNPKVQVYDTGQGNNVETAYRQALAENADFIVGPLTKAEVQAIAGIKLDIPVLALNTIQGKELNDLNKKSGKLYQFGLMPEDEIATLIEQASKRGYKKAIIVAPANEWGQRITSTFQQIWSYKGGETVQVVSINAKDELTLQLENALQQTKSQSSRKNADMIFLVGSPEFARQVTPLMNHYQNHKLPIYATSSIYSGKPSPKQDQDLNGIHFCDMPWVINQSTELQENKSMFANIWPSSPNNPRYFALGIDAYHLAAQLAQNRSNFRTTEGMTGLLHKEGQRIQRQLISAKFENGVAVPD